jgi:hypothetical protein
MIIKVVHPQAYRVTADRTLCSLATTIKVQQAMALILMELFQLRIAWSWFKVPLTPLLKILCSLIRAAFLLKEEIQEEMPTAINNQALKLCSNLPSMEVQSS